MIISRQIIESVLEQFKNISDEDFVIACNSVGMEVERIITHEQPTGLVVGEILNVQKHPLSDKLSVCTVNVGEKEPKIIVCGAPNVKAKKKCIVALQETKLFDGKVIMNQDIKTVLSQGMLCGFEEVTPTNPFLSKEDQNGIILLDHAKVGDKTFGQHIGLDDTEYEITVPSNRNDLNGIFSFCQEIAKYFDWKYFIGDEVKCSLKDGNFNFVDDKTCSCFSTTEIKNISVGFSSWEVKKKLMACGVTPVNSIVDQLSLVTTYTNVPAAVYDADLLPTKELTVKRLSEPKTILGIDGKSYKLEAGDIVVMANNEIVSLAGIIGVDMYKVTDNTKNILVEFGNFNYHSTRMTSVRLDCFTDAAKRFSKKIPNWLIKKSIELLQNIYPNGETKYSEISDELVNPLTIDFDQMDMFLDLEMSREQLIDILNRSGLSVEGNQVTIPQYRTDLICQQDIFEEILKITDFNKLIGKPIISEIVLRDNSLEHSLLMKIKDTMIANYFQETKSYNLISLDEVDAMNIFKVEPTWKIDNCNNKSRAVMRTNLIDSLLKVYEFNCSYKNDLQPIFELQKIYSSQVINNLSAIVEEKVDLDLLNKSQIVLNVPGLRAVANLIANELNTSFEYFPLSSNDFFYDDEAFAIHCGGQVVGYVGLIKKRNLKEYGLGNKKIYCLSINLDLCFDDYQPASIQAKQFNNLIPISRDISFTTENENSVMDIEMDVTKIAIISKHKIVDRFINKNDFITYTMRIWFKNNEKIEPSVLDSYLTQISTIITTHQGQIKK